MDLIFQQIIQSGTQLSAEISSLLVLLFSLMSLYFFYKKASLSGLYIYNILVVCLANIQILHVTQYTLCSTPLPLGTVLFTTLFLSNTVITDQYGVKAAQKGVILSLAVYAFFSISMILSLMHKPAIGNEEFLQQATINYQAMIRIFIPSLRIFLASLMAFGVSQIFNIFIFNKIKYKVSNLYINQFISIFLASFLDHLIFTAFAFYVFANIKPSLDLFWNGYVIGSFIIRIIVVCFYIIAAYLKKWFLKK